MSRRKRIVIRSHSIDDFPLPPGTPRLTSPKRHLGEKYSVPELNRDYRFPDPNSEDTYSVKKNEDPGETYKRLLCETDILVNQWARDYITLDTPPANSCPSTPINFSQPPKNFLNDQIEHSERVTVQQTLDDPTIMSETTPKFPFNDFTEWDLKREAEHAADEYCGEDVTLPQNESSLAPKHSRPSLRGLYTGRLPHKIHPSLPKREIPILEHAAQAHSFLMAQNRAWKEQESEAEVTKSHDQILRETREAVLEISEAGFDFGFRESDPGAMSSDKSLHHQTKSPDMKVTPSICSNHHFQDDYYDCKKYNIWKLKKRFKVMRKYILNDA